MNFLHNEVLLLAGLSWALAQVIKIIIHMIKYKTVDFGLLFASGGMPSSHSSAVCGLATAIGIKDGFGSTFFALACIFAIVVMYDATGVRLAVSKQAVILNQMFKDKIIDYKKLNELVGHTPIQVVAGAILGIVVPYIYFFLLVK